MTAPVGEVDFVAVAESKHRSVCGSGFDTLPSAERAKWLRAARSVVPMLMGELLAVVTSQSNAFQDRVNRGI